MVPSAAYILRRLLHCQARPSAGSDDSRAGKSAYASDLTPHCRLRRRPHARRPLGPAGRGACVGAAARGADASAAAAFLRAGGEAGGAGGGQRLRRQGGAEPQSAVRRPDLPPLLRRARERRPAGAALARLRRDRRPLGAHRHQRARHQGRHRHQGRADRQARVRGHRRARGQAQRSRRAAHQGRRQVVSPRCSSPIRTRSRSATWCWRSAIRSGSGRR